jgi:hypothetical protein
MDEMPGLMALSERLFKFNAYSYITHRSRPVLLAILTSAIFGIVGFNTTNETTQDPMSYAICTSSLLFALFLLIAYFASKRFPPELA